MSLCISRWFWETIESSKFELDNLYKYLMECDDNKLIKFKVEWENASLALADVYEDITHDHFSRMDFTRWVVEKGNEVFERMIDDHDFGLNIYSEYLKNDRSTWNCHSKNKEIDGTSPEYLFENIYEFKFGDDLVDTVTDRIYDGNYDDYIKKIVLNENHIIYTI
ncbi:MAG: hypothetical protein HRU38_02065 [Saccharospirillaceae bacterium]|nr:hypothetical protein [Pseudomonadales bacterium]NRB77445.1 hypothetical protein [Saccharospirillaceae bacterium]